MSDPAASQRLFSYGTLQQADVQRATFGRLLDGAPDAIVGYDLGTVTITDPAVIAASGSDTHPALVPGASSAAEVPGTVFTLTADQLAAADAYEVSDYVRIRVPLRSGVPAWVYVLDPQVAEAARGRALVRARDQAAELFAEMQRRRIVRAGAGERAVSDAIRDLAAELFGVKRFWHKRIVRSGPNSVLPYRENPPDRVIDDDDIVFVDFGPVFVDWEADFGRTYVLGTDPVKLRLAADLIRVWEAGRAHFEATPDITGEQLHAYVVARAQALGWEFVAPVAGHLVGEFPHEKLVGDDAGVYLGPGSTEPLRRPDGAGRPHHWILEVHLAHPDGSFGGFHEDLLDLPPVVSHRDLDGRPPSR